MTDLQEDDAPIADRDLLDAARAGLEPTARDRDRLRRAVLAATVGGAIGASAAGAQAASAALGVTATSTAAGGTAMAGGLALGLGGKLALGTALALALVGAGVVASGSLGAPTTSAPARPEVAAARAAPVHPDLEIPPVVSAEPPPREALVVAPAAPAAAAAPDLAPAPHVAAAPVPRREPAADEPDPVAEEARLLSRAHAAVDRHDGAAALRALDEHERGFPTGMLAEERAATRVLALVELGDTPRACAAARAFLSSYPSSIHAPRVRASCPPSE